jgi:hypothetical protein
MAEFNAQDYFAQRAQAAALEERVNPLQDKYLAVKDAVSKKKDQLEALAIEQEKQKQLDANSWTGKLDLDPHSLTGSAVNLGANVVDGVSNVASAFMSSVHTLHAAALDRNIPDEVKAAYARQNAPKVTLQEGTTGTIVPNPFAGPDPQTIADRKLLALPAGDANENALHSANAQWDIDAARKNGTLRTNADAMRDINNALDNAQTIRNVMDVSSIVHRGNQRGFDEELRAGFKPNAAKVTEGWDGIKTGSPISGSADVVSGLAGLIANVGSTAIHNKAASLEYIANNLPQLGLAAAGGGVGMALTNLPYAIDEFGKGMEAYRTKHNGELPTEAATRQMALEAASLALAETLGDKLTLGAGKVAGSVPGELAATARKSLKDALHSSSLGRIAAHTAEGAIGEFATEAYQTAVENHIEGKAVTAEDAYVGGAIGALVGGSVGGSIRTLAEATKSTPEHYKAKEEQQAKEDTLKASIASGDVSAFVDPKNSSYAPEKAVQALYGNSKLDTATPETKQANLEQVTKIIADLEEKRNKLKAAYDTVSPEGIARTKEQLSAVNEQLTQVDPADTEKVNQLSDVASVLQEQIDDASKDTKAPVRLESQLARINDQLQSAQETLTTFHQEIQPKDLNVEEQVAAINSPENKQVDALTATDAPRASGAGSVINLSMAIPERLSAQDATKLADTPTNALTEPQRVYLRAFSEARQMENSIRDDASVSHEIYTGSKKNLGIAQYRARITSAIAAGNESVAKAQLDLLTKFEQDHTAKAIAAEAAMAQGKGTQILRTDDGKWIVSPTRTSDKARLKNGSYVAQVPEKIRAIAKEATALTVAVKEMQAAYALKFDVNNNSTLNQGNSNVQNSPQIQEAQRVSTSNQEGKVRPSGSVVESKGSGAEVRTSNSEGSKSSLVNSTEEAKASSMSTETTVDKTNQGQLHSTEEAKDSSTVSTEDSGVVLTPLAQKTPEGTPHNEKRFGDFFTQNAGRDSDGSVRPLASVKDFLSKVKDDTVNVSTYLKNKAELNGDQIRAMTTFVQKATEWASTIKDNLRIPHNTKFDYEKPMNYLVSVMENNGVRSADVDENVKTAMTASVFSFVADQSARDTINNKEAINAILGRVSDTPVSDTAFELLAEAGQYQPTIADSLGGKIMDVLGIVAGQNTPKDIPAKLRAALGAHALKLMEDQGLLIRKDIPSNVIDALRNEGKDPEKQVTTELSQFKEHHFYKLAPKAESIAESMKGSSNIIQNLFGIESGVVLPNLKPYKKVQEKSDTGMLVPDLIKKVFKQKQTKDAWYVNKDPMNLLGHFSEEEALQLAGVTEVTPENTHVRNQLSRKAKNDGLIRQFKQFMDLLGNEILTSDLGLDQPMYMLPTMWKQQRAGLENNVANPQTSKIARMLVAPKEWDTEIKLDDPTLIQSFKLRVAEGLGKKTEQGASEKSVAWIDATMTEPGYVEAIKAIQAAFKDETLTSEQKQAILTANKKGGENLHTFTALIAWAKYQDAIQNSKESFTTNLMGEVDGVANGSSLNNMLYGAATSVKELKVKAERGGMYTENSSAQQYNQWYGGANRDTYQANAVLANEAINTLAQASNFNAYMIAAIWATSKVPVDAEGVVTKGGRNLLKTALNPLNYGSGFKAITRNMSAAYIDGIYAQLEEFSKADAPQESVDTFVRALNTILKESGERPLKEGQAIASYMSTKLSDSQTLALESMYQSMIAAPVTDTIKETFAPLLEKTRQLVTTTQLTYDIYNAVYQVERNAFIKELGIPTVKDIPIHDLTPTQEKELRKKVEAIVPMMNTAMSTNDGDVAHGILLATRDRAITDTPAYTQSVTFGTPLKNGAKQMTVRGYSVQDASPRVMAISGTTQALDSQISHTAQDGRNILNAHDAIGAGIGMLSDSAKALNKATWDGLLNYSPLTAAYNALQRVINGLAAMEKEGTLPKEAKEAIAKVFAEQAKKNKGKTKADVFLAVEMNRVFQASYEANSTKLGAMAEMTSFDQYAFDGGNYEVTPEDRAEAAKKLAELPQTMPEADREALYMVIDAINGKSTEQIKEAPVGVPSPFGELGKPAIKSDGDLVKFFEANPNAKAVDVIKLLAAPDRLNAINRKILQLISRTVNPNLTIQYVTSETKEESVLENPTTESRGWYVVKNSNEAIYVLSPEFKNSGLTAETLLHELVHSAIAQTIENPSTEAKALVNELETLRKQAQEFAKANNLNQYTAALDTVQEMVAWGMSNLNFQRDVLNKLKVKSKTKSNILVSGMQKFIDTLAGLLFKDRAAGMNTGLGVLISNVSGLFYEAGQKKTEPTSLNLSQATVNNVDTYSTMEIYEALDNGSLQPSFDAHLRNLLTGIVEKLHGPFGAIAEAMRKTEAGNPIAVWLKSIETGKAPFASSIIASGFAASSQEDFAMQQVEATVKAALDGGNALTKIAYTELSKLYTEAYNKLKPSDFNSQADYDFVFKLEANNGNRSDYLARFAALGLGHQGFNQMLKVAADRDTRKVKDAKSFGDRLNIIFAKILEFFTDKITKGYAGQHMDTKLEALVEQLVDIEAKKRNALKLKAVATDYFGPLEDKVKEGTDAIRSKIAEYARSPAIQNSKNGFVKGASGAVNIIANRRMLAIMRLLREKSTDPRGIINNLMQEVSGHDITQQGLVRAQKEIERQRKAIISGVGKFSLESFANQGSSLTKEDKAAVSAVVLRTGMHNLIGHFDLKQISEMLNNKDTLTKAIKTYQGHLVSKVAAKQIEAANVLGMFKATGQVKGLLMMNSHVISQMLGTPYAKQITEKEASTAEESIKALTTLYALKYSESVDMVKAQRVLEQENQRSDGNGIEYTLALHKQMEQESLEKIFNGNPTLMIHGYTPEILNPNTSIKIADSADGRDLIAQGYSQGYGVLQDRADPQGGNKRIYVLRDGGLSHWVSAAISLTGMGAKGSKKHNGYLNPNTLTGSVNSSMNSSVMQDKIRLLSSNLDPNRDLSKVDENHLAPVYNEQGSIVNWRYLMAENTKNTLLERTNDFEQILGTLAGSTFDKVASQEQNKQVIDALYEQFNKDYATKKEMYTLVGPSSPDEYARELWNMLPTKTKEDARKVWGREGMWVKQESLDIVFGYRKYSIANFLRQDQESLTGAHAIMREWFNAYAHSLGMDDHAADNYAKRLGVKLTKGERAWQEIVREAKDIIVVKTGIVMIGNIYSNESLLSLSGVPHKGRLQHHLTALKGATAYQRDTAKLAELQAKIDTGYTQGNETQIKRDIIRLKDAIDRNPVRVLVEEGLMPTIVEDTAGEEDPYSYKSAFARKTEQYTNQLNPVVKEIAKQVYMTHDTKTYQTLNRVTQLSDFVARYTYYQHLISKKNPLSHKEAVQKASEAFVNYDIPMHKGLQYTDDMGLTMFTKYFLRIQKPLIELARDNPARVLLAVALNKFMKLGPIVLDSGFAHHLGNNPFHSGAFQYPGALGQLGTVDTAMGLIK